MKSKLKNILLVAGVLTAGVWTLGTAPSFADDAAGAGQDKPARAQRGNRLQGVLDQLNLSDAQKAQAKTILDEQKEKRKTIRTNNANDKTAMRDQMRALQKETIEKIRGILDAEQVKKFDELMAQQKNNRQKPQQ